MNNRALKYYHYSVHILTEGIKEIRDAVINSVNNLNKRTFETPIYVAGKRGEKKGRCRIEIRVLCGENFKIMTQKRLDVLRRQLLERKINRIYIQIIFKYDYDDINGGGHVWADKYLIEIIFRKSALRIRAAHRKGLRRIMPKKVLELIYFELIRVLREKGIKPDFKIVMERL